MYKFSMKTIHWTGWGFSMKACLFNQFGPSRVLEIAEVAQPEPQECEVQIRLAYAGVNPVDWKIREGYLQGAIPHEFPIIPGWEGSGIVAKVGKNVRRFKEGDQVYGYFRKPLVKYGTYAQFICVHEDLACHTPKTLSLRQAAGIPLTALTAWQALFDFAKLKAYETVFIQGASGGVGGMAVQFAHWAKGKVYATSRSENHSYVLQLGAEKVFDYTQDDVKAAFFTKAPHGADVLVDCVGGNVTKESFSLVKKGGRLVSIVENEVQKLAPPAVEAGFVFVAPNREELNEISALFDHRKLLVPEILEFSLEEAGKALDLIQGGHVRGKIVLKISWNDGDLIL